MMAFFSAELHMDYLFPFVKCGSVFTWRSRCFFGTASSLLTWSVHAWRLVCTASFRIPPKVLPRCVFIHCFYAMWLDTTLCMDSWSFACTSRSDTPVTLVPGSSMYY